MGAYSPAPVITPDLMSEIETTILQPCIQGMKQEGHPYAGVLYVGVMITNEGPKVVEFNCRFGDPETQVILPLMDSDIVPLMVACCNGMLDHMSPPRWNSDTCLTVVMASKGYPEKPETGHVITGIMQAEALAFGNVSVFHAGTKIKNGLPVNSGGRVLNVTVRAPTLSEAMALANAAKQRIQFAGCVSRDDIGTKGLKHL